MNLDSLYNKQYSSKNYNCAHFAIEVLELLGCKGFKDALGTVLCAKTDRRLPTRKGRYLEQLARPVSPCLALFQCHGEAHTGVYLEGKILHLTESGVCWMGLEDVMLNFRKVRFYLANNNS